MTPLRVVTVTAMAALVGLGLSWAPRLLEPGRSERAGVSLSPADVAATGSQSDWTANAALAVARERNGVVSVRSTASGLQLVSRQLPVRIDDCYLVRLQLAASEGVRLALLDAAAQDVLVERLVPPSAELATRSFLFRPPERRVSLALVATRARASLRLAGTSVNPHPCPPSSSVVGR
jgi:hypothetical protein